MAFIYVITNDVNGKQYVGKTNGPIEKRFQEHVRDSKKERCEKRPLYSAMNKYGIEHFHIESLEECLAEESADREVYWIDKLHTYGNSGYNATRGGDSKKYYDYQEIAAKYQELRSVQDVAELFHCCKETVRFACKQCGVKVFSSQELSKEKATSVKIIETEQYFNSLTEASFFLRDNGYTQNRSIQSIFKNIKRACLNPTNTAYHFHWTFANNEGSYIAALLPSKSEN